MKRTPTLGAIVYYGPWGRVCKGIFCGHPLDDDFSIIFPLYPDRLVLDAKSDRGDQTAKHKFFACTLERNEDLFLDPQELIDHETVRIRNHMESQMEDLNKKQTARKRDNITKPTETKETTL